MATSYPTLRPLGIFEDHSSWSGSQRDSDSDIALIILNQPVPETKTKLDILWKKSVFQACADGGANQLYDNTEGRHDKFIPKLMSGDEDSWTKDITDFYTSKGCELIPTPSQDETDFTKCLRIVCQKLKSTDVKVSSIVVLGAFGGRLDHIFANVNTLYDASEMTDVPVYLIGEGNLACLLKSGKHKLEVNTGLEEHWCGLIPLGKPCLNVTTTGLQWNLTNHKMNIGGLISTSNRYDPDCKDGNVTVETDEPLLWVMGFKQ
ncbi:thiamine pyrophosphokinase 1-like [Ptychodera flava]|uniref:thiamine pyrophosphokinase 1-like n=1 Tax=Ptychodera flava TaxID=63121 RepID=UPI00396A623C